MAHARDLGPSGGVKEGGARADTMDVATIKAACPTCGAVKLRVADLTVRICADDDARGAYRFRCPRCERAVLHEATPAVCALLVSVGVDEEVWCLPVDVGEARDGPVFTHDDLLDFHLLLQRDDWQDLLVSP